MMKEVVFPISVKFEDGTIETYDSVESLETELEVFDSALSDDVDVRDNLGRRVYLRIGPNLVLEKLFLLE